MERIRVLYIGNCLAGKSVNPTTIDILSAKLSTDFEVIKTSNQSNILLRMLDIWRTLMLNRKKVDIVLIDTYSTLAFHYAWTSAYLAYTFKIPYIPFIHGGDFPKRIEKSPKLVNRFLRNADKIVAPSGYLKDRIVHSENIKSLVIPNFLDLRIYPFLERKEIDSLKILWVRALAEIYNPVMAIDVLAYLHEQGFTNATLTMVGPDKDDLEKNLTDYANEKGLSNSSFIVGRLPKREWIEMSKEYDCFINTTNIDNTPISVMEAMALGMPVISTDVGGIPYIIDHEINGILVSEGDVENMANSILSLKNDSLLCQKLSLQARKKAESWDWEEIKKKWADLLNNYSN